MEFLGRKQLQAYLLIILMLLSGFSEILNLTIIIPFLKFLTIKISFMKMKK